jgi:16S rRNA (cytosine967-C5)-methyltransferase
MQVASLIGHTQEVLRLIRSSERPADAVIDSFFRSHKYLGSHDRRFIAETTYGTLRHLRLCEAVVQQTMGSSANSISEDNAYSLLIAAYLISIEKRNDISENSIPSTLKNSQLRHQIKDILQKFRSVEWKFPAGNVERLALQYSFQVWMVEKFVSQYGQLEAEELCQSLNLQAPLAIRVNTLKTTVDTCRQQLQEEGIDTAIVPNTPCALLLRKRVNVFSLKSFKQGLFEVQDVGSQMLPLLVDPKPTERLLDACAGAGGKTLQFAALMKNRGEIVAGDIHKHRLDELRKRSRRAGAHNIRVKEFENLTDLAEDYAAYFDKVFIDAPCTGVGTIRRNPGMKWTVTPETLKELAVKQTQIVESCAPLVKRGGRLIYATCSLFKEENEDVIEDFTTRHPEFIVKPFQFFSLESRFVRLFPHRNGTDGFFMCSMDKMR